MKARKITNVQASVRQRLLNQAKATGRPFQELLQYFAMERFLFRLGRSSHARAFTLKGALMLRAWDAPLTRPTKDIDLLGQGDPSPETIAHAMRDCLNLAVPDDGMRFDGDTIKAEPLRLPEHYHGVRVQFRAFLGNARLALQVDIGFGDVVVPKPVWIDYPTLLDSEAPHLLAYTPESAIAEKFHAMVDRDLANSRMKDFYDVWLLTHKLPFEGVTLCQAIQATFGRRGTPLPTEPPLALTPTFFENTAKLIQWSAFVRRSHLTDNTPSLGAIAEVLRGFLMPLLQALAEGKRFARDWIPPGPWTAKPQG